MLSKNFILHLTLIDGIGPGAIQKIMERSDVQISDLYLFSLSDWMHMFGFSEKTASKIVAGLSDKKIFEQELYLIEKNNIQWITVVEKSYPSLLKEIHLPPVVLYFQGNFLDNGPSIHAFGALRANGGEKLCDEEGAIDNGLDFSEFATDLLHSDISPSVRPECAEGVYRRVSKNNKCLAIVGSRKATVYGQQVISAIVPDLVAANYTIVSGGALGIDTMAHKTALAYGGKTIVVLGSGLLRPYPHANKKLFAEIVERGGSIVSSYPLSTEPLPGNFPARNRIITGLSQGCLVVQAAKKSGALISAHCALEQGRDVFAVPGLFDDALSAGCHEIIQQGAKLVVNSADILNEFGDRIVLPEPIGLQKALFSTTSNSSVGISAMDHLIKDPVKAELHSKTLVRNNMYSEVQQKIIAACQQPVSYDDIINSTQLSSEIVQSELFNLQFEGILEQDFMGMWKMIA